MDIFASLTGAWTLTRAFEPGIGTFTGRATFTEAGPDELRYREDGRLELTHGHAGDAWREYRYVRDDATTIRVVLVDTGVTMHTLDLSGLDLSGIGSDEGDTAPVSDSHLCGADTYLGTYRFALPGSFTVDMRVEGPRKDYRTHTVYERA